MGELTTITVEMNGAAWRAAGGKAITAAAKMLAGGDGHDRLIKAAELLRAADTYFGRANMAELLKSDNDVAVVDAWDLTDEGFPGAVVPVP